MIKNINVNLIEFLSYPMAEGGREGTSDEGRRDRGERRQKGEVEERNRMTNTE